MIEPLEQKDINQIMDIWLEVNKKTHNYISEKILGRKFGTCKKRNFIGEKRK